jgi:hypothetical protein
VAQKIRRAGYSYQARLRFHSTCRLPRHARPERSRR